MEFHSYPRTTRYTLSECLLKAEYLDFKENFKVSSGGMAIPPECQFYSSEQTTMRHLFFMENHSDLRGYSIFYLMETYDGKRGYLVEAEKDFADIRTALFIREIRGNKSAVPASILSAESCLRSLANFF